jgi:ZIP family zinc transporter
MGEALFWGLFAGSSLLVGAAVTFTVRIGKKALGLVMGFGVGVLISAVAYELVLEAFDVGAGTGGVAAGLFAGAAAFYVGDALIDRVGGHGRKRSDGRQQGGAPLAIVLGIVLDGIPEAMVIGLGLLEGAGVSVAVIAAVFLSNLPESIAATSGLSAAGWARARIVVLWSAVMLVTGIAALAGYALFDGASARTLAFVTAFAGGAILTMLADTMMPEAFENGEREVGLATTLGFALAFALTTLE